jgi:hypothetical protein
MNEMSTGSFAEIDHQHLPEGEKARLHNIQQLCRRAALERRSAGIVSS